MFEMFNEAQYRALDTDGLNARRDAIAAELENAESAVSLADLQAESKRCQEEFTRRNAAAQIRSANIAAIAGGAGRVIERSANLTPNGAAQASVAQVDPFDTTEYCNAFMNYVQRGVAMPMELRDGTDAGTVTTGTTVSTGVPPQVPTTMGKEIISKMEEYGKIWPLVRKLSVQGGLWFRVLDLKPSATWLQKNSGTELTTSQYQKVTNDMTISFSFYMLECRMAQSLLAQAVTFADFQALFVPAVAEAMVRALEAAIIAGSGQGEFLGITEDARITNIQGLTENEMKDWKSWHKYIKKNIPLSYRKGYFIMAQTTIDEYIETLADDNNAPVALNYNPVTGEAEYRLVGMPVIPVPDDILKGFSEATAGTTTTGEVFAIYGDMNDYVVNTQPGMPMTTKRWIDDETNTEKIKALMAADGKVLDPYGFMLIKKLSARA